MAGLGGLPQDRSGDSNVTIIKEAAALLEAKLGSSFEELTIERLVVGLFFTGVKLSNGRGGICFTPVKELPEAVCCPTSAGKGFDPTKVNGSAVRAILESRGQGRPIQVATQIATLNALSGTVFLDEGRGGYLIEEPRDALDDVHLEPGSRAAVVGAMVPAIRKLKQAGVDYSVIEKDPRTLKNDELAHYVPAKEAAPVLHQADTVIITGATLATGTLEEILDATNPEATVIVLGPSSGFVPEPLFERNVDVVGGVLVKETDALLDVLSAGGSGYHFFDDLASRTVIRRPAGS